MWKAIVAFMVPVLGLPLAGWLDGSEPFDLTRAVTAIVLAAVTAVGVYVTPNRTPPAG